MTPRNFLLAAAVAAVSCALSTTSYGAAALAGGAKTSCKPTSTNPALRQIQINADPLNVQSFALTMSWETGLVTFNPAKDVFGVNGYVVTNTQVNIGDFTSTIKVFGTSSSLLPGENDVFGITFTLVAGVPVDQVLHFSVSDSSIGTQAGTDFITAVDSDTGNPVTFTGPPDSNGQGGVAPSFSGPVSILPEPSLVGLLTAGLVGLSGRRRR